MLEWLDSQGLAFGATAAPQALYDLGAEWYGTRLNHDWQPVSAAQATAVFRHHGLIGEFWALT